MNCAAQRLALATILVALIAAPVPGAEPRDLAMEQSRWVSPDDPEYSLLRELGRRGQPQPGNSGAPLSHAMAAAAGKTATGPTGGQLRLWRSSHPGPAPLGFALTAESSFVFLITDPHRQLRPLFADVRSGEGVDPWGRVRLGFRADARLQPRLTAHMRFAFDTEGANDPHNRTREFQQLKATNNIDEAYLRYAVAAVDLTLGRFFLEWGPERLGGLALSTQAPAMDLLQGVLRLGPHTLQAFAGQVSTAVDSTGASFRRHVYGHRVDLRFFPWLRLGLSEIAVVSGRGLELRYLNPVTFYAQAQVELDGDNSTDVNVHNAVDAEVFFKGGRLYGSFVADDIQVDSSGRDRWPDQVALSLGADITPHATSPWLFGYEYRRVGSWTYLHRGTGTEYEHFGRPLGAPEGPDTDRHNLRIDLRPASGWHVWLMGERRRRGENRIETRESREGHAGEPFPRGLVEKRWIATAGVARSFAPYGQAALTVAVHSIDQLNNTPEALDVVELRAVVNLWSPTLRAVVTASPAGSR